MSWSSAYPGFHLESLDAMTGTPPLPFTNASVVPVLIGGKYTATNSTADGQEFHRLAK